MGGNSIDPDEEIDAPSPLHAQIDMGDAADDTQEGKGMFNQAKTVFEYTRKVLRVATICAALMVRKPITHCLFQ